MGQWISIVRVPHVPRRRDKLNTPPVPATGSTYPVPATHKHNPNIQSEPAELESSMINYHAAGMGLAECWVLRVVLFLPMASRPRHKSEAYTFS